MRGIVSPRCATSMLVVEGVADAGGISLHGAVVDRVS
jgi:hypothetical protein